MTLRTLFILIILVFTNWKAKAQLLIGPVVGGQLSKVYFFDSQPNLKSLPSFGFEAGMMASMRVRKNFLLNAQLLFSQSTKHIAGTSQSRADSQFDLKSTMRYIELPIFYLVEFKKLSGDLTGQGGQTKTYNWFVGGGPIISYWLSNKGTLKSSWLAENLIDHVDFTTVWGKDNAKLNPATDANKENISSPNRFQFGINITGGLSFEPTDGHKIVTALHFNIAQTFFAKSDGFFPVSPFDGDVLKSKNNSIRFSVAYLFDTKLEKAKKGRSTTKIKSKRRYK